ncbi:MAG: hypothetical protein Q9N67_05290 [Ghiorsea sp.]|nr:hypothetical protein [Ghiorsea sp.]MDQ7058191.1 hypothetical protein [Ghiorsea sp.]
MENNTNDTSPPINEVQNIDQIREIILGPQMRNLGDLMFGSQIHALEKRFSKLEDSIKHESNTLRSEVSSRLDTLEAYIKREVTNVTELVAVERREREENTQHMQYELSRYANETERKVRTVEEVIELIKSESRSALLDQSKSLLSEIQTVRVSLTEVIDQQTSILQAEKTDRDMLGDIFHEVSMRLHGELRQSPLQSD